MTSSPETYFFFLNIFSTFSFIGCTQINMYFKNIIKSHEKDKINENKSIALYRLNKN